jgi:hypothetical protein
VNNESNTWRSFEKDFRAIPDPFNFLRADYHEYKPDPYGMTGWRLTGGGPATHFRAIAVLAGQALWEDKSLRRVVSDAILIDPDPFNRWLTAVREMTNAFEWSGPIGYEINDDGTRGSRILGGSIERLIENSALLCLKLAAQSKVLVAQAPNEKQAIDASMTKPKRVDILCNVFKTREDWKDSEKRKGVCDLMSENSIPYPSTKGEFHGSNLNSWADLKGKRSGHAEWNRLFGNIQSSTLYTEWRKAGGNIKKKAKKR